MADGVVVGSAEFELRATRTKIKGDMEAARREVEEASKRTEASLAEIVGTGTAKGAKKGADALKDTGAAGVQAGDAIRESMRKASEEVASSVSAGAQKAKRELDALQRKAKEVQQVKLSAPTMPTEATHRLDTNPINGAQSWVPKGLGGPVAGVNITPPELKQTTAATKDLTDALDGVKPSADGAAEGLGGVSRGGLMAGVGIAALVGSAILVAKTMWDMGRAAMQSAGEIADSSKKIGVSTDALQEWRFVAVKSGEDAKAADSAIGDFAEKLALAGSKMSKSAMKDFAALGFTPEQLKSFKSTEEALDAVVDRIGALKSESDRAAIAERLGLGPLGVAIRAGADEVANLRDEAHLLGAVMGADVVARGAEAQSQFETLNYSTRYVYGPYTAPALIGDVMPNAPGLSHIEAAFGDIFDVSGLLADARADIDAQGVEIAAARGGQPNLNSRILELNQARIDGDTANATAISLVQARTENTEADIIDLENALATETGARAEAIQQVTAKSETRGNTIPDSTGNRGVGWSLNGGWQVVDLGFGWGRGFKITANGTAYMLREPAGRMQWPENTDGVLSFDALMLGRTSGRLRVYVEWLNASGAAIGSPTFIYVDADRDFGLRLSQQVRSPAGTVAANFVANTENFVGSQVAVRRLKLERGLLPATGWSDDATDQNIAASVTQQSLAIIDLENNANLASWYVKTEASGGRPAVLGVFSSTYGNGIALGAEQVFLGDNTTIDTVSQTQQGIWGTTRRVIANGPPFGPDNLIHWAGPSDIALSAMTKANAGFWQDQNGSYGPTPVPLFWARVTPSVVTKTRLGAGSVATALNDVIVTCMGGTSGATCTWSRVSGDTSISHPNTGFAPTFSTTLTVGQIKTAVFAGLVIKGGETALVYLTVEFQETT